MIRVLFVDDELPVLDELRANLAHLKLLWNMEFVESGALAIEALKRQAFDVVATDLHMPDMDGIALLRQVQEHWPESVRLVLAPHGGPEQTAQLASVAHHHLAKPCEPRELQNVVDRCISLQQLLLEPRLRQLVGGLGRLPPAPSIYAELQVAMASEDVSVADISRIVTRDTVIAAKLMQIVNSGFFRVSKPITSVDRAVAFLGLTTVRNLVVSAEVFAKWPHSRREAPVDLAVLQAHSSQVAAVVRNLLGNAPLANDALLAALLHDIGYWALAQEGSSALAESQQLAVQENIAMDVAEKRVLGASHAEVGAYLLGLWGFPTPIVEAVAHHHAPQNVAQTRFDALAALCVAHALTEGSESKAFRDRRIRHSEIDPGYLSAVRAPFSWDQARKQAAGPP